MPDATAQPPTYWAMHKRIQYARGLARRHPCIDCGQPARHWAYDHTDPHEVTSPTGLEYSLDANHYDPRCRACHHAFDKTYRKAGVPRLHALAKELEPQIRAAIRERAKVLARNDLAAIAYWDAELERLTARLETPRAERPAARL